ncbi:S-adenosyl-L-methionine-dependent methyltransferase [Pilatotrama ljubarskyi]|nr:S-adenosyl-L-methionine-dependent methyltransferase [Pilatotrama ljubarskyi]
MPPPSRALLAQLSRAIGRESAQNEFRWMQHALAHPPNGIRPPVKTIEEMVARRVRGEPLQYILVRTATLTATRFRTALTPVPPGSQPFGPLHLLVRPPVLIPRPETEEWALRLADTVNPEASPGRPLKILDLCTGTGCIPLLLCHALPPGSVRAIGVDISEDAVQLAEENARLCGFSGSEGRSQEDKTAEAEKRNSFTPVLADLMHPAFVQRAGLKPPYDVITSNPPYIPKDQYDRLPSSVKDYEDVRALLGDPEGTASPPLVPETERQKGLSFYYRIAELVRHHGLLRPQGTLALEVGDGQAADVAEILERDAHVRDISVWKDLWNKDRVVLARP